MKNKAARAGRRANSTATNDLGMLGDLERGLEDESDSDVEEVSVL